MWLLILRGFNWCWRHWALDLTCDNKMNYSSGPLPNQTIQKYCKRKSIVIKYIEDHVRKCIIKHCITFFLPPPKRKDYSFCPSIGLAYEPIPCCSCCQVWLATLNNIWLSDTFLSVWVSISASTNLNGIVTISGNWWFKHWILQLSYM